jgi:hypothetical protein
MPNAKPYQEKKSHQIAEPKKNQNDRGRNSRRRRGNWNKHRAERLLTKAWVPRRLGDLRRPEHSPLDGMGTTRNPRKSGSGGSLRGQETVGGPGGMRESRKERRARRGFNGGLAACFGRKSRGVEDDEERCGAGRRNV